MGSPSDSRTKCLGAENGVRLIGFKVQLRPTALLKNMEKYSACWRRRSLRVKGLSILLTDVYKLLIMR
jgi:hypothetical protein